MKDIRPYTDMATLRALEGAARACPNVLQPGTLSAQSGFHVSRTPGAGMAFAGHRAYQHGDSLRDMDWKVTARRGKPHVRTREAEHSQTLWIAAELTAALFFGSQWSTRVATALDAAAFLAWQALHQQDPVSLNGVISSDSPVRRPARQRRQLISALQGMLDQHTRLMVGQPGSASPWTPWIAHLARQRALRGTVVILTAPTRLDSTALEQLAALRPRLRPCIMVITDPLDMRMTGPSVTATDGVRIQRVQLAGNRHCQRLAMCLRQHALPHIWLSTAEPVQDQFARMAGTR